MNKLTLEFFTIQLDGLTIQQKVEEAVKLGFPVLIDGKECNSKKDILAVLSARNIPF